MGSRELGARDDAAISRRRFLATSALGGAAVGLAACAPSASTAGSAAAGPGTTRGSSPGTTAAPLPRPDEAPFDTVVILMMENRSFDHFLGWLPGADGRQAGLSFMDTAGQRHDTWPLAPDVQGCSYRDPGHTWEEMEIQYADGRCDGFLQTAPLGDRFPIGYYRQQDLPILGTLATSYTTFDHYFSSMLGATWQNRLYQLSGQTQVPMDQAFPTTDAERPCAIDTTIFDRVRGARLTAGYYHQGEPMTGLFTSKKYDDITYPISRFYDDARAGRLPNVTFVEPNYTDAAEDDGTSNDYHHAGSILVAEQFVATVHDALAASPQWGRMVFVLNFDEAGGFYDHVPPPRCEDESVHVTADAQGRRPDLHRLGFRVPAIAMGPFAPARIEHQGPYEHCSILKMISWRWGLEPLTVRDRTARNFAEALDFSARRDPIRLPAFVAPPPLVAPACSPPT